MNEQPQQRPPVQMDVAEQEEAGEDSPSEDNSNGDYDDDDDSHNSESEECEEDVCNDDESAGAKKHGKHESISYVECLSSNKHVVEFSLDYYGEKPPVPKEIDEKSSGDGGQRQTSWADTCKAIHQFLETSPNLEEVCISDHHSVGLPPKVIDDILYRITCRPLKSPLFTKVQRVKLWVIHELSPAALACLLRSEQVKDLEVYCLSLPVPNTDWRETHEALAENKSLESLTLFSKTSFIFGSSPTNGIKLPQPSTTFSGAKGDIGLSRSRCKKLTMHLASLDPQRCATLVSMLQSTRSLHELTVDVTNNISVLDAALQGLSNNRSVQIATFSMEAPFRGDTFRTSVVAADISQLLLAPHSTLCKLSFSRCLDTRSMSALFQALAWNTTLKSLHLLEQNVNDKIVSKMNDYFRENTNTTLTEFVFTGEFQNLSSIRLLRDGIKFISARTSLQLIRHPSAQPEEQENDTICCLTAGLVQDGHSLVSLSMSDYYWHQSCSAKCLLNVFRAVRRSRTLQSFDAPFRCESWDDARATLADHLIDSLPRILSLRHLGLADIDPSDLSWRQQAEMLQALSQNFSLESLYQYSDTPPLLPTKFQSILNRNLKLREFWIRPEDTTGPPAGLLAFVLAMVTKTPRSASVRYEVLRRNVHVVTAAPSLSLSCWRVIKRRRKRRSG